MICVAGARNSPDEGLTSRQSESRPIEVPFEVWRKKGRDGALDLKLPVTPGHSWYLKVPRHD